MQYMSNAHQSISLADVTITRVSYNYYIPNGKCAHPEEDPILCTYDLGRFRQDSRVVYRTGLCKEDGADREQNKSQTIGGSESNET